MINKFFSVELPLSVTLVAAVKYASLNQIQELLASGVQDLGFNTWQQLEEVKEYLPPSARIHFIGHLQSNKIKKLLDTQVHLIQSVDSLSLAEKIAAAAREKGLVQNILLQVKTDPAKEYGFPPEEVISMAIKLHRSPRLCVLGLMTIAPIDKEQSLAAFQLMKKIFDDLQKTLGRIQPLPYLSMGMSDDYKIALEEGATMIRIGRKLFVEE